MFRPRHCDEWCQHTSTPWPAEAHQHVSTHSDVLHPHYYNRNCGHLDTTELQNLSVLPHREEILWYLIGSKWSTAEYIFLLILCINFILKKCFCFRQLSSHLHIYEWHNVTYILPHVSPAGGSHIILFEYISNDQNWINQWIKPRIQTFFSPPPKSWTFWSLLNLPAEFWVWELQSFYWLQISVLFVCFTEQELQATPTSTIGADIQLLYHMVDDYNRRFSGEPRSVCMEMEEKKYVCIHITVVEYVVLIHEPHIIIVWFM